MKKIDKGSETRRVAHTPAELRVREAAEGEASGRTIEGYAILFDTPSLPLYDDGDEELREVIAPEAVTRELLDGSDIKFTMFHDGQLLLARRKRGGGTLSCDIDKRGVRFSFEAPATPDGDKAVALVRAGIIDGCSFAFSTRYGDSTHVERTRREEGGKSVVTCRVKKITGIYDMTLTPDPAYPATTVEARALMGERAGEALPPGYVEEMRREARRRIC